MSPRQTTPGRNNITSSDSHKGNRACPQTRECIPPQCAVICGGRKLFFFPGLGTDVTVSVKQAHVIDLKCKPRARGDTEGGTRWFWDKGTFF